MGKISIHVEASNDALVTLRRLRLQIGNKVIHTPHRSLKLKDSISESRIISNPLIRGINEHYRVVTKEKVDEILSNPESEVKFGKKLNILSKPEYQNEINFLIFSYQNKNKKFGKHYNILPSVKEVQKMCEVVLHPFSDIIIPPRIANINGQEYLEFLKTFFTYLKTHNSKPIIGYLPFVARNELINIFKFYEDKGIMSFIVDFDNHNPIDAYITVGLIQKLTTELVSQYNEDVYLHALNIPFTRTRHKIDVTPAKDIITFMMGFDSYGSPHIPWKIPIEVVEKIKAKQSKTNNKFVPWRNLDTSNEQGFQVFRVFNRKDYGYYRSDIPNLDIQKEENESISLDKIYIDTLTPDKQKAFRKSFNVERQAIEAIQLQQVISEGKALPYLENKKYGKENFRVINKISKGKL